jgi:hypothetical protein
MNSATNASVKVMLSYDYCHFEVVLSGEIDTLEAADNMRKDAQRLADKAVAQYKVAKKAANKLAATKAGLERLEFDVKVIKENFPKSEWTPEHKAKIKALADAEFRAGLRYDYEDDWEEDPWQDEIQF